MGIINYIGGNLNYHSELRMGIFGRATKLSVAAIGTSIAVLVGSAGFVAPAYAANGVGNHEITAVEIGHALQNIDTDLLRDPLDAPAYAGQFTTLNMNSNVLTVDIPVSANEGVSLKTGDFTLDISIPYADTQRNSP